MIGKQILNYKITKIIGKGGMATVYEAIHIKLDTKVAIKVLDPILATNKTIYKRFVQEAKIMASLNHENITKVIDFDDQDKLAILMEILDGQTLNDYIKQKGALNKEEIITIFTKILEGFSYAHKKGIVHRDVKPSNIFITKEGKVKIMDFGIAKITEEGATILTQTGTQMGTPVYMSPEQVQDAKHIDFKTDIYSLGVTLWYMLTGKPIYDTTKHATFAIYTKIVNEKLPILDDFPLLSKVIQKATEKDKNNRFSNCEEFSVTLVDKNANSEETIVEEKPTLEPKIKEKSVKESIKKENVETTWNKIKDSQNIDDFIQFRKYYSNSKFDRVAKNNLLLLRFKKTYSNINLTKSLRTLSILNYINLIAFEIVLNLIIWLGFDGHDLWELDLSKQFFGNTYTQPLFDYSFYWTTVIGIPLTLIFIFSIKTLKKNENIKLVFFGQLFNIILISISSVNTINKVSLYNFIDFENEMDFFYNEYFMTYYYNFPYPDFVVFIRLLVFIFSVYIFYFIYKQKLFKIPKIDKV